MIQAHDIVLTRRDKLKILFKCLNDMVPWQIPTFMIVLGILTNTFMINNWDWYYHLSGLGLIVRVLCCTLLAFIELCGLVAIFSPIVEEVDKRWGRFEREYRENAVREIDEFLLSKRGNAKANETEVD